MGDTRERDVMIRDHERPTDGEPMDERHRIIEVAMYRAGTVYRAVCLNLGLIVERPSPDVALEELLTLVRSYVEDAQGAGLSWEETLRPVPRSERRYVYGRLLVAAAKQWLRGMFASAQRDGGAPPREGFIYRTCSV